METQYTYGTFFKKLQCCFGGFILGVFLAKGFLPASHTLFSFLQLPRGADFLVLTFLFFISLPLKGSGKRMSFFKALKTMPIPWLVSFVYGALINRGSFFAALSDARVSEALRWTLVFVPLGEEFLFRGWVYAIGERLWPKMLFSHANPLPMAVWLSAICFSLWHLQNLSSYGTMMGLFQIGYTLFLGFWLGWMRWRTGKLFPSIIAHLGLNVASSLG